MLAAVVVSLKSLLARSLAYARYAVLARNQAEAVVRLRLGEAPWVWESGENWLIDEVGRLCRTFLGGANRSAWTALMLACGGEQRR